MDVNNQNVVVVGMARSGLAAARLLVKHGARVTVVDKKPAEQLVAAVAELSALPLEVQTGPHREETFARAEMIVLSPGVVTDLPELTAARERGVPVISELELGYHFCQGRIAAVTGTNGKTTTVNLLYKMVRDAGVPGVLAGNVGLAFTAVAEQVPKHGIAVLEVSSFQLETIREFAPEVAAILNITPDHLDRYPNMQAYVEAKAAIMRHQKPQDTLVLNTADKYTPLLSAQSPAKVITFSSQGPVEVEGTWAEKGRLLYRLFPLGQGELIASEALQIPGPHNLENALAASAMGLMLGLPPAGLAKSLREFRGVAHRLEPVGQWRGISFVNDSKGTNVDAVIKALQSFRSIVLILGGRDKHGDFTALRDLIRERVRTVVVMGEAAPVIAPQVKDAAPLRWAKNLDEALREAVDAAKSGDTVLLSPGCASFDQFKNFEERGDAFRSLVATWIQEAPVA